MHLVPQRPAAITPRDTDATQHSYKLVKEEFAVAVVGLRLRSGQEDDCCATVELLSDHARDAAEKIWAMLVQEAQGEVAKGCAPDHVRIDRIPRNFKGALECPAMKAQWKAELGAGFEA